MCAQCMCVRCFVELHSRYIEKNVPLAIRLFSDGVSCFRVFPGASINSQSPTPDDVLNNNVLSFYSTAQHHNLCIDGRVLFGSCRVLCSPQHVRRTDLIYYSGWPVSARATTHDIDMISTPYCAYFTVARHPEWAAASNVDDSVGGACVTNIDVDVVGTSTASHGRRWVCQFRALDGASVWVLVCR